MKTSRLRLEYAATGFLASMRRSFVARHPGEECSIKISLSEYSEADRGALIQAVEAAVKLTDDTADKAFEEWAAKRMSNA